MAKQCPYCGEQIADSAKKCRFCGEWLEELAPVPDNQMVSAGYAEAIPVAEPLEVRSAGDGYVPAQTPNQPMAAYNQPNVAPTPAPGQTIQSVGGQPIIVNVVNQQSVEQRVEQNVEQTVVVESSGSSGSAPGWIFTEIFLIAVAVGVAMGSWWWFFGVAIGGSILLMVPFIGAAMCVVIGLAWGLIAGLFGAGIFSSTAAGWVIGIFVALGAVYGHLEARKKNMEELDEDDD